MEDNRLPANVQPKPAYTTKWSGGRLFYIILLSGLWAFAAYFVMCLVLLRSGVEGDTQSILAYGITLATLAVANISIIFYTLRETRKKGIDVKGFLMLSERPKGTDVLAWALIGIALSGVMEGVSRVWQSLFGYAPASTPASVSLIALIVTVALSAVSAVSNEIFNRGFITRTLEGVWGRKKALLFTCCACMLSSGYLNYPSSFLNAFVLGAAVYYTGSLYSSIIISFCNNLAGTLLGAGVFIDFGLLVPVLFALAAGAAGVLLMKKGGQRAFAPAADFAQAREEGMLYYYLYLAFVAAGSFVTALSAFLTAA